MPGSGAINGIRFLGGGTLIVDRVDISGITGNGIDVESASANARAVITNSTIRGGTNGIQVTSPGGGVIVAVDRTTITKAATGILDSGSPFCFQNPSETCALDVPHPLLWRPARSPSV